MMDMSGRSPHYIVTCPAKPATYIRLLMGNKLEHDRFAEYLHRAVRSLRQRTRTVKGIQRKMPDSLLIWAPFIDKCVHATLVMSITNGYRFISVEIKNSGLFVQRTRECCEIWGRGMLYTATGAARSL